MEKIWVENNWYIPVDENGYVIGPCFEGMMGCVLQLRRGGQDAKAAMKIPRLLADTVEENAYICKMTEDEESAVQQINDAGGRIADLLVAQFFGRNSLRTRRSTEYSPHEEARKQHGHVIFVYFERDKKPRFCSVNFIGNDFSIFPPSCKKDFEKSVSKDDWDLFIKLSENEGQPDFSHTVFRWHDLGGKTPIGDLVDALGSQQVSSIWYAAVPSIVFDWAEGNLQEAITKQEIKDWSLEDHFTLFEKVLNGVSFLHKQRMIHGDIRPANVMRINSQEPQNYRLGDYGSYGKEWQAIAEQGQPGGLTQVGPAIGRLRETPFYAPERRAGIEFESANIAIIDKIGLREPTGGHNYLLLLGWRSDLLAEDGSVKQEVKKSIQEVKNTIQKQPGNTKGVTQNIVTDQLEKGDRLRLRNYLFEILYTVNTDRDLKFYLCTSRYAEIIHDHLIVYKEFDEIKDSTIVDLSNYVEFHQWSAATDLYGIGALCLYSLFSCGLQRKPTLSAASATVNSPEQPTADIDVTDGNDAELFLQGQAENNNKNPDTLFVEMIRILESVPYFRFFWKELERFRKEIETLYERTPRPLFPAGEKVLLEDSASGQSLYDMALYTTNNILQSTPKARIILEQFDMNLAHFLLFMHFVLACLHRQSHMAPQDGSQLKPFAKDRTEPPMENGASAQALQRLIRLKGFLVQPFFDGFKCTKKEQILDFNPRSDFQLRIELQKLKREIRHLLDIGYIRGVWALRPNLKALITKVNREGR